MATEEVPAGNPAAGDQLGLFKEYLAEPRFRIKLDDIVLASVRRVLAQTGDDRFPPNGPLQTGEDVAARLRAYEDMVRPLQAQIVLLGKWATAEQLPTVANVMSRIADNCLSAKSGITVWLNMRWYPLSLLSFSAGIAALAVGNYPALAAVHTARVETQTRRRSESSVVQVVVPIVDAMLESGPGWKSLPGHERNRVPESEYMYQILRPVLDDLLFLGGSYEQLFDRYEVLRSLMYADLTDGGWGPVGRFAWKHCSRGSNGSPYVALRAEADQERDQWGPIKAGLFRSTYSRFEQIAKKFETELLGKLQWY